MDNEKEKGFFKKIFGEFKSHPSRRAIEKRSQSAVRYKKLYGTSSPSPPRECGKCRCCANKEKK